MKPIRPEEIDLEKLLPESVIQTWNDMIQIKYRNGSSVIKQNEIVISLMKRLAIEDRHKIFEFGYLDIEDLYRNYGWKVTYHKPDYTESWEAYFEFKKR